MKNKLLKQTVFDCAFELIHGSEGLSKEVIGDALMNAIKIHDEKEKEEIAIKAMEEAAKILGCDHAYYGEEGNEEVDRQLRRMGYDPEDFKK